MHATKGWFIWMFVYHNDVPSKKEQLHVAKYQMAYQYTNLWRNPNKLQLIQGNINRSTGYLLPVAYLSQPVATAPLTMQQPKGAVATG